MEAMNNYDGAVVELKKAVEMAPQRPGTHYKLGDAYFSLSQWDLAAEQFQAEISVDPANCLAPWKMGSIVLEKNGNPEEALGDMNRALSMCPSLTGARVDRARALVKLNRNAEAATDLEAAAKADTVGACGRDHLAEPHDRLSGAGELFDRGVCAAALKHGDHADATVEGAQHFMCGDVARRRQPLEHRQHRHAVQIQGDGNTFRQHAGNVVDEAAAGDVGERLDRLGAADRGEA